MMSSAMFVGAIGCFKRIQEFLDVAPYEDTRFKLAYLEKSLDATPGISSGAKSDTSSRRTSISIPSRISGKTSSLSLLDRSIASSPTLAATKIGQSVEKRTLANFYQFSRSEAIIITDGKFGWDTEKEPLLRGIDIRVPRTKLTMIVGPVGSGKSTLLKAMLGELPLSKGTVELSSLRVAFCDQTPWHMNGTIRESIVGVSQFDEKWYKSVIRACALEEDICQAANGDRSKVGSKGISLSGGQSQRIVRLYLSLITFSPLLTLSRP